jgi:glycosyltransferase involved in cell wall biosynthesis
MSAALPVLLDCSRMVATRWSGRMPTGIDRVCDAYRAHFAARAQAVVQLRGHARVLSADHSARLFALLESPGTGFRRHFAALTARVLARQPAEARPALYLNVSHSDFDLDRHQGWVRASRVQPVYLLHDLIPIEHPQFTTAGKTARHAGRVRGALEGATGIIANSRDTARAIRNFAQLQGLAPPPLLEAPLGASLLMQPRPNRRRSLRATFVCVSTIEHRKNHMLLLDVWQRLIATLGEAAPRLVLIGRWGVGGKSVRQRYRTDPQLHRFVTIHNHCTDAEIARHLGSASALLAPSRAEGFGLPVAEALRMGVPVIASDLPAFREAGGMVPTFLDPAAIEAWLRMIRQFADDGPERQRQLAALKAWRAPDWGDHFALVDGWLESLIRPAPAPTPERLDAANDWCRTGGLEGAIAGARR